MMPYARSAFARGAALLVASISASALVVGLLLACGSSDGGNDTPAVDSGVSADGPRAARDGDIDAGVDSALSGRCADKFGSALTEGFGRIDGVVYAVQKPSDKACAMADKEHVVVQVLMGGSVYGMVVDVNDPKGPTVAIHVASFPHVVPGPEYEDGWHTGIPLDYANILGAHSADGGFAPLTVDQAIAKITAEVRVGDPVSVYGITPAGRMDVAEGVHRNTPGMNEDGAIIVGPTSATPTFLLFHFEDQTF